MFHHLTAADLRDRLAHLPTDRRVSITRGETRYGTYYAAKWYDSDGTQHKLHLGCDTDGTLAALRAANQRKYQSQPPITKKTLVRDMAGSPVIVDSDIAAVYFLGEGHGTKRIHVCESADGTTCRMVFDDSFEGGGKYISLETWCWEARHEERVPGGYRIIQAHAGNDYSTGSTGNLVKVRHAPVKRRARRTTSTERGAA